MASLQSAELLSGVRLLSLPTPRFKGRTEYDCGSAHGMSHSQRWGEQDAMPKVDEVEIIVGSERMGAVGSGASPQQMHSSASVRSQGSIVTSDSRPQSRLRQEAGEPPPRPRRQAWPDELTPEAVAISAAPSTISASSRGAPGHRRRERRVDVDGGRRSPAAGSAGSSSVQRSAAVAAPVVASGDDRTSSGESPRVQHRSGTSDSPVPSARHDSLGSAAWALRGQLQQAQRTPSPTPAAADCGDFHSGDCDSSCMNLNAQGSDASAHLPLISATPYAESVALEHVDDAHAASDGGGGYCTWGRLRKSLCFLLIAAGTLGGAGLALYGLLPRDHSSSDLFKPTCNVSQALACTATLGEWDNQCNAFVSGFESARGHCCNAPAALSCWHKAYCAIDCPELPGAQTLRANFKTNWDSQSLAREVQGLLGLEDMEVTATARPCDPTWCNKTGLPAVAAVTADVKFCVAMSCDRSRGPADIQKFLWQSSNASSKFRSGLGMYSVPWVLPVQPDSGGSRATSLLENGDFSVPFSHPGGGWHVRNGDCAAVESVRDCHNGSSRCVRCVASGDMTVSQDVPVSAYPGMAQWSVLGWFALPKEAGVDARPNVEMQWLDESGDVIPPQKPEDGEVFLTDPWATGYLWPRFLPFVWIGDRPMNAASARLVLGCKSGKGKDCVVYFDHPSLVPAPPACNPFANCIATRCQGPLNQTHDICQTARSCRGPAATPYDLGDDVTLIEPMSLWPGFVFVYGPGRRVVGVGASLSGALSGSVAVPERAHIFERGQGWGNGTGDEIPFACKSENVFDCINHPRSTQSRRFQYAFNLVDNSSISTIPNKVNTWRVLGESGSSLCVDVTWYPAPHRKHVMDITVDPTGPWDVGSGPPAYEYVLRTPAP
eukprot:TRINITY_DN958_c7_g1_i1.p1 TRINITY_DN958_c7_g1~~TRINITY_DN958_c7_g1_i1.p1  ORF type:complete len:888 (+),score=228.09 TRINITY_DN958_c7_g1_i1:81-2744(+)